MKKLIILRSLPGAGKSFLAKSICDNINHNWDESYVVLSTDDVVSAGKYYLWHPDMIRESHHVNQIKCKRAMELGIEDIIVDNTNTTWKEIAPYVKLAKEHGYAVEVREPDTTWKFDVNECFKRNSHGVPLESIKKMFDRWETTESINLKVLEFMNDTPRYI